MEKIEALKFLLDWVDNQTGNDYVQNSFKPNLSNIFILENKYEVYLKSISWKTLLSIDAKSFNKNSQGIYFSTEIQKREILKYGLEKIKNISTNEEYCEDLLSILSYDAVEKIWIEYQNILHLTAEEANIIYNSAKKYFNSENNDLYPVLPEVIEMDYILKGIVSLSRTEFNTLSSKEFEIMQLVLSTKNEVLKQF